MPDLTYQQMNDQFFERYNDKDYAGALSILNEKGDQFPEQAPYVYYNRACMYGVQNCVPEALGILQQAAAQGFWYREQQLRQDTDLAALQTVPEFEQLVERFNIQYQAIQTEAQAKCFVSKPANDGPYPVVLAMHGNNSNAGLDEPSWKSVVENGWLLGALQSSQIGMTRNAFIWDNEEISTKDVLQHFGELQQNYAVDQKRVVIGGFSMGGGMATLLGLTQPAIKGFIGVGPYVDGKLEKLEPQLDSARERGVRAYLLIGDQDDGCYPGTLKLAEMLKAHGIPYQLKVYPGMAHVYPPDFAQVVLDALKFITEP
jgi:hypothetical protein